MAETPPTKKPPIPHQVSYGIVPTGYPNLVAMTSTMQSILNVRRVHWGRKRVVARTRKIQNMVASRLKKLRTLDWKPAVTHPIVIYRCPPFYVLTRPAQILCGIRDFCPNCWARRAVAAWRVVDDAFFLDPRTRPDPSTPDTPEAERPATRVRSVQLRRPGKPTKHPERLPRNPAFDLIERYQVWEVPHLIDIHHADGTATREYGVQHWLRRRTKGRAGDPWQRKGALDAALVDVKADGRPWGVLEVVRIYPASGEENPGGWRIFAHQIMLVPRGVAVHDVVAPDAAGRFKRSEAPTRRQVAVAVAFAFHYPAYLLDPATPSELVLQALQLRGKARMMEMSGIFRARGEA